MIVIGIPKFSIWIPNSVQYPGIIERRGSIVKVVGVHKGYLGLEDHFWIGEYVKLREKRISMIIKPRECNDPDHLLLGLKDFIYIGFTGAAGNKGAVG
jgi:hypothetical protein